MSSGEKPLNDRLSPLQQGIAHLLTMSGIHVMQDGKIIRAYRSGIGHRRAEAPNAGMLQLVTVTTQTPAIALGISKGQTKVSGYTNNRTGYPL